MQIKLCLVACFKVSHEWGAQIAPVNALELGADEQLRLGLCAGNSDGQGRAVLRADLLSKFVNQIEDEHAVILHVQARRKTLL